MRTKNILTSVNIFKSVLISPNCIYQNIILR